MRRWCGKTDEVELGDLIDNIQWTLLGLKLTGIRRYFSRRTRRSVL